MQFNFHIAYLERASSINMHGILKSIAFFSLLLLYSLLYIWFYKLIRVNRFKMRNMNTHNVLTIFGMNCRTLLVQCPNEVLIPSNSATEER